MCLNYWLIMCLNFSLKGKFVFVLISFLSTCHSKRYLGREAWTERIPPSQWPVDKSVQNSFINDRCGRTQAIVGDVSPGQVVLGWVASKQYSSALAPAPWLLPQSLLRSCLTSQWWTIVQKLHQTLPSTTYAFGQCCIRATEKGAKTVIKPTNQLC